MEICEFRTQLSRVRAMLQEQRVTLEAMPANESRVFKALQTFILDVLDVMDMEEEGKDEGTLTLSCYFNGPLNTLGSSNVVMALPAEPEPVAPKPPSKNRQAPLPSKFSRKCSDSRTEAR